MESNTNQHKSFLWHLAIEPFTWHSFYGEQCPLFVTEENKEAWNNEEKPFEGEPVAVVREPNDYERNQTI